MDMTHYMELLADNQPWNLLIFMAVPVVLAETLAITELFIFFTGRFDGLLRRVNRSVGIVVGLYFAGIILWLTKMVVIPVTQSGEWRTVIDMLAVGAYLVSGFPLVWIALQDMGLVNKKREARMKWKIHAICVTLFLVFGHIAMIAGMASPALFGYQGEASHHHAGHDTVPEHVYGAH